jgi:hypothetical protein
MLDFDGEIPGECTVFEVFNVPETLADLPASRVLRSIDIQMSRVVFTNDWSNGLNA